jgi:putative Mg2+ transporter-C (MgtC) family protein
MPASLQPLIQTTLGLSVAFVLGGLIGFERQWRQRNAGLRTMVLVSVGAAAFVDLGGRMGGGDGFVRVIAYVVSGIGFLGAGVIMKEGAQVRGLNTAATLWSSAAVGAFAGAGQQAEAALVTIFILAGNTLLRPLADFINRRPIKPNETEALYRVHVQCETDSISDARDLLFEVLEAHNYPIREIETLSENESQVELAATLVPTTADPKELDQITDELSKHDAIETATWTVSTMT